MGIQVPDLIVESVIRDGLEYLRQNPDVIDDIFVELTKAYAAQKYGSPEISKIKSLILKKNIAIVHSFHLADSKSPCYSIQLGHEAEAKPRAHLGDFEADVQETIDDESELVRVPDFTPESYNAQTGMVQVDDSVDLSPIAPGFVFYDASGNQFEVKGGYSNEPGSKYFFLDVDLEPNLGGACHIDTFLNYTQFEAKGETSEVNLLIGVHTRDALLTKYLYSILKYILFSRKSDLIKRGFVNSSFQGSDFTRDLEYQGDVVYTRFFTATGQVDDSWSSDDVELVDKVVLDATPAEDSISESSDPETE